MANKKTKPTGPTDGLVVDQEVLKGIFAYDPAGTYYSKDGETFLNEVQFEELEDKSGFEKFENI